MIRLIASDLDGTMLWDKTTLRPRTIAALQAAHQAGIIVVAATGRQLTALPDLLAGTRIRHAVGSNGAIAGDLGSGEVYFEDPLPAEIAAEVIRALETAAPGTAFLSVRDHGALHFAETAYLAQVSPAERALVPMDYREVDRAGLLDAPSLKLAARHPDYDPETLAEMLTDARIDGCEATTSGAPFLEVQRGGVNKATGLAQLCAKLGIPAAEVMAFGDARNDIEMLTWAGTGIAMGNAVPETVAAADHTIGSNREDGLAEYLETLLADGQLGR